jgi:hypothetical protein
MAASRSKSTKRGKAVASPPVTAENPTVQWGTMTPTELQQTVWTRAIAEAEKDQKTLSLQARSKELEERLSLEMPAHLRQDWLEYDLVARRRNARLLQHCIDVVASLLMDVFSWARHNPR